MNHEYKCKIKTLFFYCPPKFKINNNAEPDCSIKCSKEAKKIGGN